MQVELYRFHSGTVPGVLDVDADSRRSFSANLRWLDMIAVLIAAVTQAVAKGRERSRGHMSPHLLFASLPAKFNTRIGPQRGIYALSCRHRHNLLHAVIARVRQR